MTRSPYKFIRFAGDRDRDVVLDLQAMHWGPDRALNERHFAWKDNRIRGWRRRTSTSPTTRVDRWACADSSEASGKSGRCLRP